MSAYEWGLLEGFVGFPALVLLALFIDARRATSHVAADSAQRLNVLLDQTRADSVVRDATILRMKTLANISTLERRNAAVRELLRRAR